MDLAPVYPWHWNTAVFLNIFWCLPSEPQPCKEYGLQKEKLIPFIMQWIIILYAVCQSKCTDSVSQNHGCSYQNALVSRSVGFSKCWASPSVGSLKVLGPSKCGSLQVLGLSFTLLSLNLARTLTVFASLHHPTVIKHYLKVTLTLIVSLTFHHVKIKLQLLSLHLALTSVCKFAPPNSD